MHIPEKLQEAIEQEVERCGWHKVLEARKELTERYRQQRKHAKQPFMFKEEHRAAYLATRMPATFCAISDVLSEVRNRLGDLQFHSMLDLGSGPGTGMWAATQIFPEIDKITLIERDMPLSLIGKRLAQYSGVESMLKAHWENRDLQDIAAFEPHDLVLLSYAIGELPDKAHLELIEKCWQAAIKALVIIEPGTPVGFERIREIRKRLIELNANMIAPCPHVLTCPMKNGDWCHFSARLERTSMHRRLKEGTLGYEDEKYSYIAVVKQVCELPESRVLRQPIKKSGFVSLTLCYPEDVRLLTISKRDPEAYRKAKKLDWGSGFN